MKVRCDFVTNSSSSCFVTFGILSTELREFIKELYENGDYRNGKTGYLDTETIIGEEVGDELSFGTNVVNITRDLYQMNHRPDNLNVFGADWGSEYSEKDKGKDEQTMLNPGYVEDAIKGFFFDLPEKQNKQLSVLVNEAFKKKNVACKVYVGQTDGFLQSISKAEIMRQNGSLRNSKSKVYRNPELDFFESRSIDPLEADLKGKTIGIETIYRTDYSGKAKDQYFKNAGTAFDVAVKTIEYYGGKATKTISSMTDYVVISKQMNKAAVKAVTNADRYVHYCEDAGRDKALIIESDVKRAKKNKPQIRVMFEEVFLEWLEKQFDQLSSSSNLFSPFGVIKVFLCKQDFYGGSHVTFKSDSFADITEDQMKAALAGAETLEDVLSSIEGITKAETYEERFVQRGSINKLKRLGGVVCFDEVLLEYSSSSGIEYKVSKKLTPNYEVVPTTIPEMEQSGIEKVLQRVRSSLVAGRITILECEVPFDADEYTKCIRKFQSIVEEMGSIGENKDGPEDEGSVVTLTIVPKQ